MRTTALLSIFMLATAPAIALDATCEIYLSAAEKSTQQPARHSVTEPGDGTRIEAIIVDGRFFANTGDGWMKLPGNPGLQGERKLVASIRAGKYPMKNCRKLGTESVDGRPTSVVAYVLELPGNGAEETRAYIGADGLVYRQTSGKSRVNHRYTGVSAPKP